MIAKMKLQNFFHPIDEFYKEFQKVRHESAHQMNRATKTLNEGQNSPINI